MALIAFYDSLRQADRQPALADAEIACYRALVDYNLAILQVYYHKGSLLEYEGIRVAEGRWEETPTTDPFGKHVRGDD